MEIRPKIEANHEVEAVRNLKNNKFSKGSPHSHLKGSPKKIETNSSLGFKIKNHSLIDN